LPPALLERVSFTALPLWRSRLMRIVTVPARFSRNRNAVPRLREATAWAWPTAGVDLRATVNLRFVTLRLESASGARGGGAAPTGPLPPAIG
jgi:hypothetical protein